MIGDIAGGEHAGHAGGGGVGFDWTGEETMLLMLTMLMLSPIYHHFQLLFVIILNILIISSLNIYH